MGNVAPAETMAFDPAQTAAQSVQHADMILQHVGSDAGVIGGTDVLVETRIARWLPRAAGRGCQPQPAYLL